MDADVIVVGGGPVGIGLAIDLAQRGVSVLVVERHTAIQSIPKGQNLTQRSGEHFRSWGVSERIRERTPIPPGKASGGLTCYRSLLSKYRFDWFQRKSVRAFYAADNERLPQYETEAVLRERLGELPNATLLPGWSFVAVEQDESGVRIAIVETGGSATKTLKAAYLVGCDGARSAVRTGLEIDLTVDDPQKKMVLLTFRSHDLDNCLEPLGDRAIYKVLHPDEKGYWNFFGRVDLDGGWFFHAPVPLTASETSYDFRSHLEAVVGSPFDFDIEHVGFWDLRFAHADSYRSGRAFLAGDAAHSHPPYGGYGINTGFEDARNLGWKLAAELNGWAGAGLLDSYHAERHPVFASTRDDFIAAYIRKEAEFLAAYDPDRDEAEFERAWATMADSDWDVANFFPNYRGSPVVVTTSDKESSAVGEHTFRAEAGCHLPPRRLADGSNIYDCLGAGFTLIAIEQPATLTDPFATSAARLGVPLTIVRSGAGGGATDWRETIILVRPDHFVGFAGSDPTIDVDRVMRICTGAAVQ